MLWSALKLPDSDEPSTDSALQALAVWALQFTPRVTVAEEAVLLEVAASLRLFGGRAALRERLWGGAQELGAVALAWAPNALAALALARAEVEDGVSPPLARALDALPMATLSAVRPHQPTLARIGCRTLGDLRRLPRAGLARRFDAALLAALETGQIGHATLDVFRVEPLPPEHPYWAHPKVTVTPHIAADTRASSAARVIAENIRRGEAGEPFLNLVDRVRGY